MHLLNSIFKHLLRSLFSIIIFLLFVGMAKTQRNIYSYIDFLGAKDWSTFSWSQPATWGDPFWPKQVPTAIADIFSGDDTTIENSGLDVYDPSFEQNLNEFSDNSFSGSIQEDFGFTTGGQTVSGTKNTSGADSQSTLLDLIKQREFTK